MRMRAAPVSKHERSGKGERGKSRRRGEPYRCERPRPAPGAVVRGLGPVRGLVPVRGRWCGHDGSGQGLARGCGDGHNRRLAGESGCGFGDALAASFDRGWSARLQLVDR